MGLFGPDSDPANQLQSYNNQNPILPAPIKDIVIRRFSRYICQKYRRMKKTLVLGASTRPDRYAYRAALSLQRAGHPVVLVGNQAGEVGGEPLLQGRPDVAEVDTVTLYLNPVRQREYYDYILALHPKRIIFNPGTENPELVALAEQQGIVCITGCTLVMLSVGTY
jgi:predicted CoA-binding protein